MIAAKFATVALAALCFCACSTPAAPKSTIHSIDTTICAGPICSICAKTSELPK